MQRLKTQMDAKAGDATWPRRATMFAVESDKGYVLYKIQGSGGLGAENQDHQTPSCEWLRFRRRGPLAVDLTVLVAPGRARTRREGFVQKIIPSRGAGRSSVDAP